MTRLAGWRQVGWLVLAALAALGVCHVSEGPVKALGRRVYAWVTHTDYCAGGTVITCDANGVPSVDYGTVNGVAVGRAFNAVQVADYALVYYERRANPEQRRRLLGCADWLVAHAETHGDAAWYVETFPWPEYHLTPPWRCGLAEGRAIAALVRAHQVARDPRYLNTARRLTRAFYIDADHGGVTYKAPWGWWYEEYADDGGTRPRVLNGMIYTVLALHDFAAYTHDPKAAFLVSRGLAALAHDLPRYALPDNYSAYDALGNPAGDYHQTHVRQLRELYALTGNAIYQRYAAQWARYREPFFAARLLHTPTKARVALYLGHVLVLWALFALAARAWERRVKTP
jgi:hypothetical protein